MNNEEFEKSKKELEKAKLQNDEQIIISDERTRMAKVNSLEYKGLITLFFSMSAYMVLLLTSSGLITALGTSVITNIFPGFTYPIALIGSSIGIGIIGRMLFDKKFQTKKRLKVFSNAKTEAEKLEEEVHYQIELEKAKNRNRAIDESIKVLDSNQAMLSRISSRYDLSDKNAPQTKEESKQKAEELSNIIKEQYDKLDIITTQKVLHDRFWKVRQKFQRRTNTMIETMMSAIFTMIFTGMPVMLFSDTITLNIVQTSAPAIIGAIGGSTYILIRSKNHKRVFNNLNAQLGENKLPDNLDEKFDSAFEEQVNLEESLANQIRDISLSQVQLQEYKRYFDTYLTTEDKKIQILETPFKELHITEEMRQDVLERPERYTNCDPLPGDEEKGPTLVKKIKFHN